METQLLTQVNPILLRLQEEEYPLIPYLTTLPLERIFSQDIEKRILQWRRLGFDVSDCEPEFSVMILENPTQSI